ncbi:MAG: amidohydrolase, partial [Flavobacteriales bacterium]
MRKIILLAALSAALISTLAKADTNDLAASIKADYQNRLGAMFRDFHINPELSTAEFRTAKKLAKALRSSGFKVTEGVGGTGVVALLENGPGPLVMMRGDIDGLPL